MGLQNDKLGIIRMKVLKFRENLRIFYYRTLGMKIGKHTSMSSVYADWPSSISLGSNCNIQRGVTFWVQSPFKKENNISIGDNVIVGRLAEFNCCDYIKIGNNCLIASYTVFVDSSHSFALGQTITEQSTILKGIDVEDDVWIGTGAKILLGVRLGRGCIIGAGAVVNKNIPPYEIWAGVPAKKISERR